MTSPARSGDDPDYYPVSGATPAFRLGARFVDWLILVIPLSLIVDVVGGAEATYSVRGILAHAVAVALAYSYDVALEGSRGATIGKAAFGIEVEAGDGAHPSYWQAAKRNLWQLVNVVPVAGQIVYLAAVGALGLSISKDPRHQGLHDRFAEVTVARY
jgi:uncharacterized RDD family membrane protein YckC